VKRPRAWALAFGAYAYSVTVAVSALFLVRDRAARGLPANYAEALGVAGDRLRPVGPGGLVLLGAVPAGGGCGRPA
jgi:hypothetical protein